MSVENIIKRVRQLESADNQSVNYQKYKVDLHACDPGHFDENYLINTFPSKPLK